MKTLLNTCYIVWGIFFFGKNFFPLVLGNSYVFWSVNIGLIVLISIGFVKSLFIYFQTTDKTIKSIYHSASFLSLFLVIIIIPITVHYTMRSMNTCEMSVDRMLHITDTSTPETEENREYLASFLFSQYGIKIPYKADSGDLAIFKPTEEQVNAYQSKLDGQEKMLLVERDRSRVAMSSMKLATIQIVLFFIVFVLTMIYEQKRYKS